MTLRLLLVGGMAALAAWPARAAAPDAWVAPMKQVHAKFTGAKGTFAQFGDSITYSMAFWSPVQWETKNAPPAAAKAQALVKGYQKPECWSKWKGPEFGNEGRMTIRWACDNVDRWLARLNPEVAVIMFGSNDVGQMDVQEYEAKYRVVLQKCLSNGTIVIVTTLPPRSGQLAKCRQFAEVTRKLAAEFHLPVIDYFEEILKRRPEDWDGTLPQFKAVPGDVYQVPTLISRDGVHPSNPRKFNQDFSEEALRSSGFGLRNYLTLMAYAEVIERALQ